MKNIFILSLMALTCSVMAADAVSLAGNGRLNLNGSRMEWRHAPSWKPILLKNGKTVKNGDTETVSGAARMSPEHSAVLNARLQKTGDHRWRYSAEIAFDGKTDSTGMEIKFPVAVPVDIEVSGKLFALSGEKTKGIVYSTLLHKRESSLALVAGNSRFTFTGSFRVRIVDARVWSKEPLYSVSIVAELPKDRKSAGLEFTIEEEPLKSIPVSIASAANMGFRDDSADDGKGGWTDQGPGNDLSCMEPGNVTLTGIEFNIADPGKSGKSCIVLSGERKFPPAGIVNAGSGDGHRYLYLLHAAAWVPPTKEVLGTIVVTYADSTRQEIPVRAGIDCGNWWRPMLHFLNGQIAWIGENGSGKVGLFSSAFRLRGKPVRTVEFRAGKGVWMIAAASFANMRLGRAVGKPFVITEGSTWKKYEIPLHYRKGSPLDFSSRTHAPAGKFGRVIINPDGHFAFENAPGKRIRFFGTNICQRLVAPTHGEADALAERLSAEGYNSIRFHQFEKFIMDWSAGDTISFDKVNLDRFHYFYAKLREKGMYITTDVYATRPIRPGDGIAECRKTDDDGYRKVLQFFSDSAMANWKEYARRVFTMKNPYTGMSMAEDPAFFAVNLDNEAPLYAIWKSKPALLPLISGRYVQWLKEKNLYTPELAADRSEMFQKFLAERQTVVMDEEKRFLREELGVKAIITNLNNVASPSLQPFRDTLPLLDQHIYHDHPTFPMNNWQPPVAFNQSSDIAGYAGAMRGCMPVRIPGKPMIITEINYCYPNQFRSEMGALAGAYSALQDWDGLYRFCYEFRRANIFQPKAPGSFSSFSDPVATLTERIIWFLFVRGDVMPAGNAPICYTWDSELYGERFPAEFSRLGLIGRIGSVPAASKADGIVKVNTAIPGWRSGLPAEFRNAADRFERKAPVTSLTGEITLDPVKVCLRVVSPRSEVLTFRDGSASGKFLRVKGANDFVTVSVHSLDGKPLPESRELLLFHLTDSLASGARFQSPARNLLLKDGVFPMLIARGKADVSLAVSGDGWLVDSLNADGSVLAPVGVRAEDGGIAFSVNTHGPRGTTMIYHIRKR